MLKRLENKTLRDTGQLLRDEKLPTVLIQPILKTEQFRSERRTGVDSALFRRDDYTLRKRLSTALSRSTSRQCVKLQSVPCEESMLLLLTT